jgi:hypothetical protein
MTEYTTSLINRRIEWCRTYKCWLGLLWAMVTKQVCEYTVSQHAIWDWGAHQLLSPQHRLPS